jgi:lysyl-tRNA synthetase, class I
VASTPKTAALERAEAPAVKPKTATPEKKGPPPLDLSLAPYAKESKAWPFEEARKIVARLEREQRGNKAPAKPRTVLFETRYGPSGLPHIGTFGEVARTTMVRNAFRLLTEGKIPTRLLCFSDDMDGMRKVPENVPNQAMLRENLHRPLTRVPDPFGEFESFGHHNNAMLRRFLDTFHFDYEFASATEYYLSGKLDATLLRAAERYQAIMDIMLPTLGEERQATYSCFLPISPKSGRVLYVPMKHVDGAAGTITFDDEDGSEVTLPVTGGKVKLQWKPDFGARWAALGVDFEMYGKDHGPNTVVYDGICKAMGGAPPEHYVYELFLDDKGQKISKSKGNGLTIDEWLTYASPDSLSLFMFNRPREAKKLHFDVIPKTADDYSDHLKAYVTQTPEERLINPVWHIHGGTPPAPDALEPSNGDRKPKEISFGLLINLVSGAGVESKDKLWGFIRHYAPAATPETHPRLDALVGYAIAYYHDRVKPTKQFRPPTDKERAALAELAARLRKVADDSSAEELQNIVYEIGKTHQFEPLRDWFKALYEVLFGQSQGPRFGSFIAVYGVANTMTMIEKAVSPR